MTTYIDNEPAYRYGFELETQSIDGDTADELCNPGYSDDTITEMCWENFSDWWNTEKDCPFWLRDNKDNYNLIQDALLKHNTDMWDELTEEEQSEHDKDSWIEEYDVSSITLLDLYNDNYIGKRDMTRIQEDEFDNYRENWEAPEDCTKQSASDWADNTFNAGPLGYNLTAEEDSTVNGLEIQTTKGLTYEETIKSFKHVIDTVSVEVNEECSFHVHLSRTDKKHIYGAHFQYLMMRYVLSKVSSSMTTNMVDRLANTKWRNYYFSFLPDCWRERKTAIAYREFASHKGGNRWEFRLFGNVSTIAEAEICLTLARNAYDYATRMRNIIPNNSWKDADELFTDANLDELFRSKQDMPLPSPAPLCLCMEVDESLSEIASLEEKRTLDEAFNIEATRQYARQISMPAAAFL